jgi:DNA-binding MarR family transcriptional regulator
MSESSRIRPGRRREKGAAVDELVSAVLTASRVLVGVSAASLAEIEDTVTLTQFRTLIVLDTRGPTNLNGLAESLGVNSSTAMRMVDKLLAAGLVTRRDNSANRREVVIAASPAGTELARQVTDHRRAEIAAIVRKMPAGQRNDLVRALSAFSDAAGEPAVGKVAAAAVGW